MKFHKEDGVSYSNKVDYPIKPERFGCLCLEELHTRSLYLDFKGDYQGV